MARRLHVRRCSTNRKDTITTTDVPTAKGDSSPAVTERERRLYGFAVLVALGDDVAATAAWQAALAAYPRQLAADPDTPADGWLRRRVLDGLHEPLKRRVDRLLRIAPELPVEARARLRALGASDAAISGLRVLLPADRGMVIASSAEHLDAADLRVLVGRGDTGTRRMIARAMGRYVRAAQASLAGQPWIRREPTGELAERVAAAAGTPGGPG